MKALILGDVRLKQRVAVGWNTNCGEATVEDVCGQRDRCLPGRDCRMCLGGIRSDRMSEE